jgi:hypothetical protein
MGCQQVVVEEAEAEEAAVVVQPLLGPELGSPPWRKMAQI